MEGYILKSVIFDMDGVIIDSEPIHVRLDQIMFKELGINIETKDLEQYIGVTNKYMWSDMMKKFAVTNTLEELLDRSLTLKIENLAKEEIKPIEGIIPLLKKIKAKGLTIAVASSSPEDYIKCVLNKFGILNEFDFIISGNHVQNSKPAPDIFLLAASKLNVKPTECVVIEDSTHGVTAAKRASMKCIGFNNINSKNQNLIKADYKVNSIIEIVNNFDEFILE